MFHDALVPFAERRIIKMKELKLLNKPEILLEKEIIIYGTSWRGRRMKEMLNEINASICCFCNIDGAKGILNQDKVIDVKMLREVVTSRDICIIIAESNANEIIEKLEIEKVKCNDIYNYFTVEIAIGYLIQKKEKYPIPYEKLELKKKIFFDSGIDSSLEYDNSLDKKRLIDILRSSSERVICFTPGKTGSKTIYESLTKSGKFSLHFHDLEAFFLHNNISNFNEYWESCLKIMSTPKKLKIIAGVREPIARDISQFFQILGAYYSLNLDYSMTFVENVQKFLLDYTINASNERKYMSDFDRFTGVNLKWGVEFDWYEIELKKYFGIDIYNKKFDQEKGFQIYENEYVEVFVYQLEKLGSLEHEIGSFIEEKNWKLESANQASNKIYNRLYKDVMNEICLDSEYIDFYYKNNKAVNYFYSELDRNTFYDKWRLYMKGNQE